MHIRRATARDQAAVGNMVMESFEPITWLRKLDERYGPVHGADWRVRWKSRMEKIFATQIVLLGEIDGELAAMSSSTADSDGLLAYIDLLAVSRAHQQRGHGRQMLDATLGYLRDLGMRHVYLDCLTDNSGANALYESQGFEEIARQIRWVRKL